MPEANQTADCRQPFAGPAAWFGRSLAATGSWIYEFSPTDVAELLSAARRLASDSADFRRATREGIWLPTLGPRLESLQQEVVDGRGFVLLRGFPVDRCSRAEAVAAYWLVGLYFGDAVPQNAKGHLIGHVIDLGKDPLDPRNRVYETSYRHLFHTDSCDIVGLLCLSPARSGGASSIASSVTIFNEMLRMRPDLVEELRRPLFVDRKGEIPLGKLPYYELAVFHEHAGCLTTIYSRDFIEAAQRHDAVPRLTDRQREAMLLLESTAARDDVRLDMNLQPGDIQFLHNHQVLHARTAYEDDPTRRRHLLRLWLSASNGRPLPAAFAERYGDVEVGTRRGGIVVPGAVEHIPLEPSEEE